ncbi:hypothetical protein HAX54_015653 [Datura stramonium]|uniref:Uncharacterized protein n=1 Tax=Datura stramonium TaxID=4076 RepID=A0ABS8RIV1_DATST|nr:hypothetical protein [Datura stramonium]
MDVEILSTTNGLARMICSVMLETALAAQKSLLSLLFMSEFLCLYRDLVGVERRYWNIMIFHAQFIFLFTMAPDNEPKDSSETDDDDDYENEDAFGVMKIHLMKKIYEEDDEEGGGGGRRREDEEENNQPPYKKIK